MTMTATQAPDSVAPFTNEPINDFRDSADAAAMRAALETVKRNFGKSYPLVIDGRKIETEKKIRSLNPADPEQVVGSVSSASKEQATQAIEAAARAFESWKHLDAAGARRLPFQGRRSCCASGAFTTTRSWFTKSARAGSRPTAILPRRSTSSSFTRARRCATRSRSPSCRSRANATSSIYIPLGVGAVIPPWNFAGAIMMGMTARGDRYRQYGRAQTVERCRA